jgi:hypothetical protein
VRKQRFSTTPIPSIHDDTCDRQCSVL